MQHEICSKSCSPRIGGWGAVRQGFRLNPDFNLTLWAIIKLNRLHKTLSKPSISYDRGDKTVHQ
jgi:hypothetical protein